VGPARHGDCAAGCIGVEDQHIQQLFVLPACWTPPGPGLVLLVCWDRRLLQPGLRHAVWVSLQPRQSRVVIFRCTTAGAMRILSLRGAASLPPAGSPQMRLLP
jgi:hypothetical protein